MAGEKQAHKSHIAMLTFDNFWELFVVCPYEIEHYKLGDMFGY